LPYMPCPAMLLWRMAPKVKIEDVLPSGERITISIEGERISKTKVLQILELLSIVNGSYEAGEEGEYEEGGATSLKERVWSAIVERYGDGAWFTLKELYGVLAASEPELKITTLASYLAKFVAEGRLVKRGQKPATLYRVRAPLLRGA